MGRFENIQGMVMTVVVSGSVLIRCGVLAAFGLLAAGCDRLPGGGSDAAASATVSTSRGQLRIEERDVEAPDIFSLRSSGLWDGRPTFGGIWVAVSQRVDPDRVKITNLDNGQTVEGGLFRKEADTPGPSILVSSDAAAALGMQAGTPARMDLVVLRRETVEIAPPPPITVLDPEPAEDAEEEAVAVAGAASEAAAEGISTEALETTVLEAVQETETAASGAATAVESAATAAPAAATAAAAAAPVAAPQAAPPVSELERPYIQVATVSSPANANKVIKALQAEGLSGELRIGQSAGKTIFSVVIGPAATTEERTQVLRKVRSLGYKDAYPV